jgi:membrane protease YdiL (CAAX protease family)
MRVTNGAGAVAIVWGYLVALCAAEALIAWRQPTLGLVLDSLIVAAALLPHAASGTAGASGAFGLARGRLDVLPALALVPLLRLLSLTLPNKHVPEFYWNAIVMTPIFFGIALTMSSLRLSPAELSWRRGTRRAAWLTAASGLPLGALGYLLLRPAREWHTGRPDQLVLVVLILAMTAAVEETLFRGVLLGLADYALGARAVLWVALVQASLYIGTRNVGFVALMVATGLLFGAVTRASGSLWGALAARVVMLVSMATLWRLPSGQLADAVSAGAARWLTRGLEVGLAAAALGYAVWLLTRPRAAADAESDAPAPERGFSPFP